MGRSFLAVIALAMAAAAAASASPHLSGAAVPSAAAAAAVGNLTLAAAFVEVDFDWSGSPWADRAAAVAAGAFIPANNIITGLALLRHEDGDATTYFACVPRWRPGVPSTLNTVVADPNNSSRLVLRPWPSWAYNREVYGYVQAVYMDDAQAHIYVIDTGRQNFFGADPALVIDAPAKLHVYDLKSPNLTEVYFHEFPNSVFPYADSFLNDIVVDAVRGIAYMSDTNVDPDKGAVIAHNMRTGYSRRFVDPNSTCSNATYHAVVNGIDYFSVVKSPADGIALSSDGAHLLYSVVQGAALHALNASMLADPAASHAEVKATVRFVMRKPSFSDGLRLVQVVRPDGARGDRLYFGAIGQDTLYYADLSYTSAAAASEEVVASAPVAVASSSVEMQWMDSFATAPRPGYPAGVCPRLAFSTNRLQQYFVHTMNYTGGNGANFRFFEVDTC